jgi:hypothetical protein
MALHVDALRPATNQNLNDYDFRNNRFPTGIDASSG